MLKIVWLSSLTFLSENLHKPRYTSGSCKDRFLDSVLVDSQVAYYETSKVHFLYYLD